MKAILVVFLGLVALAAASNAGSQDAELSQLKKLLLRALERKIEEQRQTDASKPNTPADAAQAPKQQQDPKNPSDKAAPTTTNQGPSEVKPATEKDQAKPATEKDQAKPATDQNVTPKAPGPAHNNKPQEKPAAEEKKPAGSQAPKPQEKPDDAARKPDEKPNDAARKPDEKPQDAAQKPDEKPQDAAQKPDEKPEDASRKPDEKPDDAAPKPANPTQKPPNATHQKTANSTAGKPANNSHKPSESSDKKPANTTHKPAGADQNTPVVLPPHIGQGPSGPKDDLAHPDDVIIVPEDPDELRPAGPKETGLLSLPISVLAFMMSSDVMKAAPMATTELAVGMHHFDVILRHVIHTLRNVADDVRKAPSLAESAGKLERDMEKMSRVFIPAQRGASAAFFRVMVYGLEERTVCDLESEDVTDCVAGRMQSLARLFTDPEHMDAEINKMARCNRFTQDKSGGKEAVAHDLECIADGVSKVMEYLRKMKDTVSEIQLAGLLNGRPLPKYNMDLDDVEDEVSDELEEQFKGIMSLIFRLMLDGSEMGRAI